MELFSSAASPGFEPLAARMRPRTLNEYVGQEHIIGPGRLLRRAIKADQITSVIFYGPPGTGKTTLARVIANTTKSNFVTINAVLAGVKEIRETVKKAQDYRVAYDQKTILFVDEVHRWNKAQQDALLPWVENGTIILIGATIENPYFEVNRALLSRSRIFQLKPLTAFDLRRIVRMTFCDTERGYGKFTVICDDDALDHLIHVANGDARSLLNALELAVETTPELFPPPDGETIHITLEIAEQSIQKKAVLYDKEGDYHFDTASAFIKSLRGSDPDAALYWCAKMVHAGEDPRFIFRRMLIFACEDVGMADPTALTITEAAAASFDRVGMPEGRFHLAHAVLYLSTCPKSHSAFGFFDAIDTVSNEADMDVPNHLKDSNRDKNAFGHGKGYLYPHAYRDHWVAQQYLPDSLKGSVFYRPGETGYEAAIKTLLNRRREAQLAAVTGQASPEVLTFSPPDRTRDVWFERAASTRSVMLGDIRDEIFSGIPFRRHETVLVLSCKDGLLLWEALRKVPEGGVVGIVARDEERKSLEHYAGSFAEFEKPILVTGDIETVAFGGPDGDTDITQFDAIVGRNTLTGRTDKQITVNRYHSLLSGGGKISIAEIIPSRTQRLSGLEELLPLGEKLLAAMRTVEDEVYHSPDNPIVNWTEDDLYSLFRDMKFRDIEKKRKTYREERYIREKDIERWFRTDGGERTGYGTALKKILTDSEFEDMVAGMKRELGETSVVWKHTVAFLRAVK
ncbi:MAG: AAA family ATPase [Spirochaetales bacterium]|nr:AAA family ATPase [Spirochaetales bacterium]